MFLGNWVGAGDVKLLSAASLWAGPHLIAVLLIVTAIAGGFVSLFMAVITHRRNEKEAASIEKSENKETIALSKVSIPYGIAIATGGLATLGMIIKPILLPG